MSLDHVDMVQEYALVARGEHPKWEGDRVLNAEAFATRIGRDYPGDVPVLVRSLSDAETEYSKLSGLPPSSLKRLSAGLRKGARIALSQGERGSDK